MTMIINKMIYYLV